MAKQQQPKADGKPERFESDTDKLVHRHLADENHVITEEELQSIRIGQTLPAGEAGEEVLDRDEKAADRKADGEGELTPGSEKVTPWDVVE